MRSRAILLAVAATLIAAGAAADDGARNRVAATVVNFDLDSNAVPIVAGQVIDTEYAGDGITISATNNVGGSHPDLAIAFDSSSPPGHDLDLGTPNEAFAGPGVGSGGTTTNSVALGNLLIIAENGVDTSPADGLIDDPDDEAGGGSLLFEFDMPVTVNSIVIIDIDTNEPGACIITNESGGGGVAIPIPVLGDNSVQTVDINRDEVESLEVHFPSSGACTNLQFTPMMVAIEDQTWGATKEMYRE